MRISDWSSDVCSSDLSSIADIVARQDVVETSQRGCFISREPPMITRRSEAEWRGTIKDGAGTVALGSGAFSGDYSFASRFENGAGTNRSEEHTSELLSLMRISYAVFCLKKKRLISISPCFSYMPAARFCSLNLKMTLLLEIII